MRLSKASWYKMRLGKWPGTKPHRALLSEKLPTQFSYQESTCDKPSELLHTSPGSIIHSQNLNIPGDLVWGWVTASRQKGPLTATLAQSQVDLASVFSELLWQSESLPA